MFILNCVFGLVLVFANLISLFVDVLVLLGLGLFYLDRLLFLLGFWFVICWCGCLPII